MFLLTQMELWLFQIKCKISLLSIFLEKLVYSISFYFFVFRVYFIIIYLFITVTCIHFTFTKQHINIIKVISIHSPLWAYKSLQIHINLMCMFTVNCQVMLHVKNFFLLFQMLSMKFARYLDFKFIKRHNCLSGIK